MEDALYNILLRIPWIKDFSISANRLCNVYIQREAVIRNEVSSIVLAEFVYLYYVLKVTQLTFIFSYLR
jgi:hypothetical protein